MGERKGQNKYYPPDYDPKVGGLNKFLGTHALRERARKLHLGIMIIRFEMPYNIWCEGCKNHIGMGVRYNAEKTKVGMYYSTAVYQFRMKCHLCENYIVIKTDPGNLDYEVVSGARRQENRWDPTENGQIVADTKEIQRKLFDDPMYKLEHTATDAKKSEDSKPILGNLYQRNSNVWYDNFEANSRLRATFRKRKKELKTIEDADNALLSRSSLSISLVPETEQDRQIASLMRLQSAKTIAECEKDKISDLMNRPALPSATVTCFGGLKREKLLNIRLQKKDLGIVKKITKDDKDLLSTISSTSSSSSITEEIDLTNSHKLRKLSRNSSEINRNINDSLNDQINIKENNIDVCDEHLNDSPECSNSSLPNKNEKIYTENSSLENLDNVADNEKCVTVISGTNKMLLVSSDYLSSSSSGSED